MTDAPRIEPLAPGDRDDATEELLAGLRFTPDGSDLNLFATLARHPRLLKRWSAFGGTLLLRGALPHRDREVLILRTAANTGAAYEWGHHLDLGRAAGLTDQEVAALVLPADEVADALGPDDVLLVRAADALHLHQVLDDDIWAALAERYDEQQLIEVCMVVGQYHLVAFTLRSLRIQPEPGVEGLPA